MTKVKADLYRRRLATALSRADDEHFIQLCWSVDAIQSERVNQARRYITFSDADATADPASKRLVYKWAIETLVNEILTTRKTRIKDGPIKRLDCSKFNGIAYPFDLLNNLENEEYGLFNKPEDVLKEMSRIGFRQFAWQRKFLTAPNLTRSIKLFGGREAGLHFENQYNLRVEDFVLSGFATWAFLRERPVVTKSLTVKELDLSPEVYDRTMSVISRPIAELRTEAMKLRSSAQLPVAYKPSILRRFPCISFDKGQRVRAPLVNLVLERVTSGLYYDVITGGGGVRNEIGKSFESYCRDVIAKSLIDLTCLPETKYINGTATPDILIFDGKKCRLVAECKAKRMTVAARFGDDPMTEAPEGFNEVGKGMFQIWRHFSYVRRGLLPGHEFAPDAMGVVFTLDPWLQMTSSRYNELKKIAEQFASGDPEILTEDKKLVAFCPVQDLESTLSTATTESLLAVLRQAASEKHAGHLIQDLHSEIDVPKLKTAREYALASELVTLLPWWGKISELKRTN